jgi:hypothetical protein
MRRIFGLNRDEVTGGWRKLHSEELHDLYSLSSIIIMMKSRKMKWPGHVARMEEEEEKNAYRLVGKPGGKRLRIMQVVYLQSVPIKTHTICNQVLIVGIPLTIGDPDVIRTQCIIREATSTTPIAAVWTALSQPIIVDTVHLIA